MQTYLDWKIQPQVLALMADSDLREKLGAAGRAAIEARGGSLEHIGANHMALYEGLFHGHIQRPRNQTFDGKNTACLRDEVLQIILQTYDRKLRISGELPRAPRDPDPVARMASAMSAHDSPG